MLDQLTEGRSWQKSPYPAPEQEPFEVWLAKQKARVLRDIKYRQNEIAQEIKRCEESNTWVQKAIESL